MFTIIVPRQLEGIDINVPFLFQPNKMQHRAVAAALTNSFSCIQGPPGIHTDHFVYIRMCEHVYG